MKNFYFFFLVVLLLTNCTKEFILDVRVNPVEGGNVFPSEGTFKEGSTVTLNATPNLEYQFTGWSGDANGTNTSVQVTIDDNKNVVANFKLRQYELITNVKGEGIISESIVNTGKSTDYDSGTTVRLEAVPSKGYYFTGWSGDLTGETNPAQITIDKPKNVTATFEKLSYELRIQVLGEGSVSEQIINTGKSTDYLYDTTVRLTATSEEGSDFIEWEDEGALTDENPFDITVTEPTFIKAIFEYDLFNEVVGKWKVKKKKPKREEKSIGFDVYNIVFYRNRTFKLNYSSGQISGTFTVTSNSEISLNNIGLITNVIISQDQIDFNINITSLFQFDVTGNRVKDFQQYKTAIPDQYFEQGLIDLGYDNSLDGYIDDSALLTINNLDLSDKQISNLSGLEEFINLTSLNLSGNSILSISLVNLNKLTSLDLRNTGITELDLSQNNKLNSLYLSGNTELSCVKVSPQIYQQIPAGWIYDNTTSFELECDCPILSLISGTQSQTICDGEAMGEIVFEFGGTDVNINVETMPCCIGIQSNTNNGQITISGTPVFTKEFYTFSVFTSDGNNNCNQVSQTITLNKNQNTPSINLDSGSYLQNIELGNNMVPIVVTFDDTISGLNVTGLPYTQLGNAVTIYTTFDSVGTYRGTITTISNAECEIDQSIEINVTSPINNITDGGGTSNSLNTNETNSSDATGSYTYNENNITFTKEDGADPNLEANQDRITRNVWITRGNGGGQIFNAKVETNPNNIDIIMDKIESPIGTKWAIGTLDQKESLYFENFRSAVNNKPKNIVGTDLVLYLVEDNIYLSVKFTSWSQGRKGGFSYIRSFE